MAEKEYTKIPTKELENGFEKPVPPKYGFGVRHVQSVIIFIIYSIGYMARSHLGVTIVAMTNDADVEGNSTQVHVSVNSTGNSSESGSHNMWDIYQTFHWTKSTQEMVLSSFFVGYCVMTFLSGPICQRFGGKIPLQIAMFVNGVVSILSPWVVAWGGDKALCFCRILQGISQGGLLPSIHTLLANWVPLSERGTLSSYVYTGSSVGTVVGFQFSGVVTSSWGWPAPFWAIGVISLIGFGLVTVFCAATPNDHKTITEDERNYIVGGYGEGTHTQPKVPWKAIMSSRHAWATFIAHTCSASGYVFFFIQVPTYVYAILKVNIKNSGLLSSLPYFCAIFSCILFGSLADILTNRKIMSMKNTRRFGNTIGALAPAVCLLLVTYTARVSLAVTCFVLAVGLHAAVHSGWVVNYIDLSPNYSGVLMAIGNGMGNLFVLVFSGFVSYIITDVTNVMQWRITMFLAAAISILGNVIFFFFLSTDVQPWNEGIQEKEPENIKLETQKQTLKVN